MQKTNSISAQAALQDIEIKRLRSRFDRERELRGEAQQEALQLRRILAKSQEEQQEVHALLQKVCLQRDELVRKIELYRESATAGIAPTALSNRP